LPASVRAWRRKCQNHGPGVLLCEKKTRRGTVSPDGTERPGDPDGQTQTQTETRTAGDGDGDPDPES
jgi:hypothetical protein